MAAAAADPSGPPVLECRGLGFSYRAAARPALSGIDLRIGGNRLVGIAGRGGAGKSTLLRCFNRIVPEFHPGDMAGDIQVLGDPIAGRRVFEMARRVGMVFQDFESQLFSSSVDLEAGFGAGHLGVPDPVLKERVDRYLTLTGLDRDRDRDPARLSGGEKQKLAIASVLAMEPALLLLDEPTTDLDPGGRTRIWELVRQLRGRGTAVLVAEHETEEFTGCDEVLVLDGGRIVMTGRPDEVLTRGEELHRHGIRVPDLVSIVRRLTGEAVLPRDAGECHRILRDHGIGPDERAWRRSVEADRRRAETYGGELIAVEDVHFRYPDDRLALRGVSFRVRAGEFIALLGANGSGKTTVAKHLNGLLHPGGGRVLWKGTDLRRYRVSEMGRRVGFVFQNPDHQIFSATVAEEVAFAARNFGLDREEVGRRVAEALRTVGLEGRDESDPFLLTKGERQRLAVASVLAARPPVLVLDEPTTGLDRDAQAGMMELLERLNREGHTLIIITHALSLAARHAHRCLVFAGGRVLADGPAREVFSRDDILAASGLRPPPVAELGKRFGRMILSVEEFLSCCGRPPSDPPPRS